MFSFIYPQEKKGLRLWIWVVAFYLRRSEFYPVLASKDS